MADDDLDFEHADFATDPERPAPAKQIACSVCRLPIAHSYFTRDDAFVCARCEGPTREAGPPGSPVSRFGGATALGALAAGVSSALWMLVTKTTGYEIGLIAIVVGMIVGAAVRAGSRDVGGLPYQVLAALLTYTAIVLTYVPAIVDGLQRPPHEDRQESRSTDQLDPVGIDLESTDEVDARRGPPPLAVWVVAIGFAFAVPFLGGMANILGLLIIGFGIHQAWSMTTKHEITWAGPFEIGTRPDGATA